MINTAKCPHCQSNIGLGVNIGEVKASVPFSSQAYVCVSYSCRSCNAVLSIQMDPIALNTDLRNDLKKPF